MSARRIAFACALFASALAARASAQTVVDLTPPTGTQQTTTYFFNTRGYTVTFSTTTFVSAIDLNVALGANDTYFAHIWDNNGVSLAVGTTVNGAGVQQYYRSNISFLAQANVPYRFVGFVSNTADNFPNKNGPTLPYAVGNITVSADWSGVAGPDSFPTNVNVWGPSFRVVESPHITVAPTSFDFGQQRINTTSATQNFVVTNTSNANLVISALNKAGPFNVAGPGLPVTIGPNASTTFTASFAPTVAGAVAGSMTISSNDPLTPNLVIPLQGTGVVSKANLNPVTINFGNLAVNTVSAGANVTLTNAGNATLNLTANPTVTGPYQLTGLVNGMAIAANASTVFSVKFAPVTQGSTPGSISIASDDPASPTVLTLNGVGTAPSIAAAPASVNFGSQAIGGGGVSQNVTLTNTGNVNLTINALSIGGANPGDYMITLGPNLPATVAANSAVNVTVNFKPVGHAGRNATLVVASNALNAPMLAVPLTGVGTGPQLTALPSPVQFGNANVSSTTMMTLTVTNTGEANLVVNNFTFAGPNGAEFTSAAPMPFTLVPNGTTPIAITWQPTAAGPRTGAIVLASNDPVNPTATVNLLGTALAPMISLSSMSLDFGKVLVGNNSAPMTLTVTNSGNGPLTVSGVSLGGPDAGQFQFNPGVFPVTIQPQMTHDWSVTFAPMAVGKFNGMLTLTSDDPMMMSAVVPITGDGTSPMVAVDQMTIDFGAQLVAHTSAQRTATVTNSGTAPLTISTIMISGPQGADFMEVNAPALPLTLMPGDKQPIVLTLTPPMMGQEVGTLLLDSDDPKTPQVKVKLTGSGVSSVLSVSPMAIDFGVIKAPGTGTPKMVTITNSSGDPITLVDAKVSGMSAGAFTVDTAAGTLMPGEMKMVAVHATANTAGDLSGTATFGAMDNAIPTAAVTLSAKGVSALIVAMPSTLDFGMVSVGTTSATQKVMVMNQSSAPVQLKSVASDNPGFVISGADTTSMIAPGMGSAFDVAFAPSAVGAAMGKISITLVGGSGPEQVVMAMGTGKTATAPDMGTAGPGGNGNSGGCNCSVGAGSRSAPPMALLGLLVAAIVAIRRRRPSTSLRTNGKR